MEIIADCILIFLIGTYARYSVKQEISNRECYTTAAGMAFLLSFIQALILDNTPGTAALISSGVAAISCLAFGFFRYLVRKYEN